MVDAAITGGAGFIGSQLTRQLVEQDLSVRVIDLPGVRRDHLPDAIEFITGDVSVPADAARAVAGARRVYHLAANPNLWARDVRTFDRHNHRAARTLLDAAVHADAERIVHVSTESILTRPQRDAVMNEQTQVEFSRLVGPYCRSKWLAERYAMSLARRGAPIVVVSPTVPVGPGASHSVPITRLIADFANGRIHATLDATINLIDVRDAAAGIAAAGERGEPDAAGRRYLIAGENWSTAELFDVLAKLTGRRAPTWHVPFVLALAFAWCEEQYCRRNGRVPMATVTGVRLTRRSGTFDDSISRQALGLTPRPVEPAIAETLQWLIESGRVDPSTATHQIAPGALLPTR